ncbi:polyprenol monophosphomannose synthase [Agromyces archimandritae]|uniref:Polyprenol monophosphomannose synthase n=1 Tax=Agromyces archimandritae TaxID=2781962 RepID=A0A975FM39_9MICO|nr:polyprenol monophosphomannose synthase [Agromyces archimandritae]QTX03481.1 polyprenol monophosphomannose synthase [Agromyces archimandritae]
MSRTVVVVPTYNERESLPGLVERVRGCVPDADVLVVDDASPDGTGAVADALAAGDERVSVLHRAGKEGLGAAYLDAFARVLDAGYDVVVQMDADGSHRPEHLPAMLARLAGPGHPGADVVIGSRWVPGGGVENWPWARRWLSRTGSAYARGILRLPTRDATAGYRVFTADALRAIRLGDVHTKGYGFQVDMLWHAHRAGLDIVEEPIVFVEREHGSSKMSLGIVVEAMWRVTVWGIGALFAPQTFSARGRPRSAVRR